MTRRVASALLLAPIACAGIWFGAPLLVPLLAVVSAIMCWEWGRLVGRSQSRADDLAMAAVGSLPVLVSGFGAIEWGAAVGAALLAGQQILAPAPQQRPIWTMLGLAWIVLPCMAFCWLRALPDGLAITVLIVAIVWSVDIGAYVVGRSIGGPRLAPQISPNKTWAGLLGGIAAAMFAGWLVALLWHYPGAGTVTLGSGALAVIEQMGDMAESYAKRRFGVKDSSSLIPGHGGMLDRLDGMLAVVVAVFFIVASR
jgi:phosphatidate cytidylyltransferase